jgi:hypothetical protein
MLAVTLQIFGMEVYFITGGWLHAIILGGLHIIMGGSIGA